MNYYEAQEFFKKANPNKKIDFELDEKCHRVHEIIYTDGFPNPVHHIESNQLKVTVEGSDPVYVPIAPHREACTWEHMQGLLSSKIK